MKKMLTPLEWEIMNSVWKLKGTITVREVLEKTYPNGEKAYTTVQSIMNILVEKGYMKRIKKGNVNLYKPKYKKAEFVEDETKTFVERIFGGSFLALANHLVDNEGLTSKEIKKLRDLINNKDMGKQND